MTGSKLSSSDQSSFSVSSPRVSSPESSAKAVERGRMMVEGESERSASEWVRGMGCGTGEGSRGRYRRKEKGE